ncbi:MAG: S41 family peptidase [Candidatus Omnitrophica bacterium]|nr:S41 family peptidase [Candidatus Omnitrophota bacterium]MCA9414869.1 S41 family peptidase [Candidatus Omnitrophota bacterium]MCA9423838.1 S41 family peptidase [Candidatus Omnitrophota bacterium]MCA9433446.1 S41 family peptidase [Candidatus Omnitrophota bacterium]MCA9434482.1 S41 family peptidase [Candidatus Omnitrophota bacterium]
MRLIPFFLAACILLQPTRLAVADPIPTLEVPEKRVNPLLLEAKFQEAYSIIENRYIDRIQSSTIMIYGFRQMLKVPGLEGLEYKDLISPTQRLGSQRDDFQAFRAALQNIRQKVDPSTDMNALLQELIEAMIQGMVNGLDDPYSAYLAPEKNRELQEYLTGVTKSFAGIGIRFEFKEGRCRVVAPIPDTPAYRAGIRPGDVINLVDGAEISNEDDAREKMMGDPGSQVVLTVEREAVPEPLNYSLIRESIIQPELEKILLPGDVGYVRINSFNEHSGETLLENLRYLETFGMKKCLLDLRQNAGGLLKTSVEVADIFLPRGSLVTKTHGRAADTVREHRTRRNLPYTRMPLVVLVDHYTASAAEIVTGAIRDNRRGKVVGDQTFGKGTVQEVRQLDDNSAIKLTVAQYLTPSGESIHHKGIAPDYPVHTDHIVFPSQYRSPQNIDLVELGQDKQVRKALEILGVKLPIVPGDSAETAKEG